MGRQKAVSRARRKRYARAQQSRHAVLSCKRGVVLALFNVRMAWNAKGELEECPTTHCEQSERTHKLFAHPSAQRSPCFPMLCRSVLLSKSRREEF